MAKIVLDVNDKNVETVMMILENLKSGLINKIDGEVKLKSPQYKPKSGKAVQQGANPLGKYLSKDAYKERLSRNKRK